MFTKRFIGWSALVLFVAGIVILAIPVVLILSPTLDVYTALDPQAVIVASGVVALISAVVGLFAFKTSSGQLGIIGGMVVVIAVAVLLSFTTIAYVEPSRGQPQPVLSGVESH